MERQPPEKVAHPTAANGKRYPLPVRSLAQAVFLAFAVILSVVTSQSTRDVGKLSVRRRVPPTDWCSSEIILAWLVEVSITAWVPRDMTFVLLSRQHEERLLLS